MELMIGEISEFFAQLPSDYEAPSTWLPNYG